MYDLGRPPPAAEVSLQVGIAFRLMGRFDQQLRRLPMNDFAYATDLNIKRFQKLMEISVGENERRMIQVLLAEQLATKAARAAKEFAGGPT